QRDVEAVRLAHALRLDLDFLRACRIQAALEHFAGAVHDHLIDLELGTIFRRLELHHDAAAGAQVEAQLDIPLAGADVVEIEEPGHGQGQYQHQVHGILHSVPVHFRVTSY